MKILEKVLFAFSVLIVLLLTIVLIAIIRLNIKTNQMFDDYSSIYLDPKYQTAVFIDNVTLVEQRISCGYAVIEMFAKWTSNKSVTEQSLYDKYGSVVTSSGKAFEEEMNKQFPDYHVTMQQYLKNTELIDKVYDSLSSGYPVPFEWAAKYDNEWTLHYSLIIGMDIPNNLVTILNPYGYEEKISIGDFLDRTSFRAFENMPLFFRFGFVFGMFEKNTIFTVEKKKSSH